MRAANPSVDHRRCRAPRPGWPSPGFPTTVVVLLLLVAVVSTFRATTTLPEWTGRGIAMNTALHSTTCHGWCSTSRDHCPCATRDPAADFAGTAGRPPDARRPVVQVPVRPPEAAEPVRQWDVPRSPAVGPQRIDAGPRHVRRPRGVPLREPAAVTGEGTQHVALSPGATTAKGIIRPGERLPDDFGSCGRERVTPHRVTLISHEDMGRHAVHREAGVIRSKSWGVGSTALCRRRRPLGQGLSGRNWQAAAPHPVSTTPGR